MLQYVGIFYKLRNKLPACMLKDIYFAFVHSHVLYGVEIYANTCLTYLDKLIKLNNKLLQIMQHRSRFCHVRDLYVNYYTLTKPELHTQQPLTLVHKTLYHSSELPDVFSDYFTLNRSVDVHETRSQTDIHIYKASTAFGQRSIKYKGGFLCHFILKQ